MSIQHTTGTAQTERTAVPMSASTSTSTFTTTDGPGRAPLAVLLSGTFLVVLDFFIVNVALPSIQRDLQAGTTALEWLVAGYGLTFGGLLLVASRLGDRHGRRKAFSIGIGLFVLASAACGLAPGIETLLAARLLQGAAAAVIAPTVLSLIGDVYTGPARVRALGVYATVMGLAAALGQLIGGVLLRADILDLGWRWIFLVNVPIGLVALVVAPRVLPDTKVGAPAIDLLETVLAAATLVAVMLPLTEGRQQGWPRWTGLCLAAAAGLGALLAGRGVVLRRRGGRPLLDGEALRDRSVVTGLVGQFILFTGMASYFLVLALYLQQGRGLGPLESGLVFTVVAVTYMIGTGAAARLARFGVRRTVTTAALTFGLGHLALLEAVEQVGVAGSLGWLIPGLAIGGLGMGVALAMLVGLVMTSAQPAHAGVVSGTSSTVQQLGNALGVALIGIVYFGAVGEGSAQAFSASLGYLAGNTLAVAAVGLALPRRA
jgi:EmrB/QacA subfamily drug resistance transporter